MIALSSVLDDDLYGGAFSAVAIALRYAACGYAKAYIHLGLQDHLAPGFGKRHPDGDPAAVQDLCIHEQIDRADHRPLFAEGAVDIIQTVGMAVSIVVEKIVHLWTAARVQQVVLTHLVISHFKHRSVKIGIYHVAGLEFQRFVAVYGYSGGKEFIGSFSAFCEESTT